MDTKHAFTGEIETKGPASPPPKPLPWYEEHGLTLRIAAIALLSILLLISVIAYLQVTKQSPGSSLVGLGKGGAITLMTLAALGIYILCGRMLCTDDVKKPPHALR